MAIEKTKDNFSVEQIQAILKSCRESGVTQMKLGSFSVQFSSPEPKTPEVVPLTPEQIAAVREYENQAFLDQEKRIKMEKLSHLRLTDPEMYEELQNRGELEHVGEESEGIDA